jgi:hydroxymethylglutaryl-CoA reductase
VKVAAVCVGARLYADGGMEVAAVHRGMGGSPGVTRLVLGVEADA